MASRSEPEVAPLLSVIVPTCHRSEDLAVCLDALRPQEQKNPCPTPSSIEPARWRDFSYEVIVTDDGSRSIAEALIRDVYPWVRWYPGPRRGPAANRNSGARKAEGEWVLFLDDDCVPLLLEDAAFRELAGACGISRHRLARWPNHCAHSTDPFRP
jgi:glycosyltransferase involved in cell wall biosynthesis